MLKMTFVEHNPPTRLELELNNFVNSNIVDMLRVTIDHMVDGFDMSYYFPRGYYDKNPEYCNDFIYELYDTMCSGVLYDELSVLQSYVVFQIIDEWPEVNQDIPELLRFPVPDELKKKIYENKGIPFNVDPEDYQEELFIIEMLENVELYNEDCFDDTDFLEEDIRALVECAINGLLPLFGLTYEELDEYIIVMPMDVAERYQKFRMNMKDITVPTISVEEAIVLSVQNAMKTFARRAVQHQDKKENVLTADLQEKIEDNLSDRYGVLISREYTIGRAITSIGETDLYFYMKSEGITTDIAILENKNIENFKDQYFQLMGYLNPYFKFGMTVSINRKMTIEEAERIIANELRSIEGDFAVLDVYTPKSGEHYLMSEHIIPETGEKMRVYHFILNLCDRIRVDVARKGRKRARL